MFQIARRLKRWINARPLAPGRLEAKSDEFKRLFPKDVRVERVATGFRFTEGPIWCAEKRLLLFSADPACGELRRVRP